VATTAPVAAISSSPSSKTTKLNGGAIAGIIVAAIVLTIVLLAIWKRTGNNGHKHGPTTVFNPVDPSPELSATTSTGLLLVEPSTQPLFSNSAKLSQQQIKPQTDYDISILIDKNSQPLPAPSMINLEGQDMTKTPLPLPLPLPPPLPKPFIPSQ
jgi:hypothetical protein